MIENNPKQAAYGAIAIVHFPTRGFHVTFFNGMASGPLFHKTH